MAFTINQAALNAASAANVIIKVNGSVAAVDTVVNFLDSVRIEALSGYELTVPPQFQGGYDPVSGGFASFELPLVENNTAADGMFTDEVSGTPDLVVYTQAIVLPGFNITQAFIDKARANAATIQVNGVDATEPTNALVGDTVSFVADSGFIFEWVNESAGESSVKFENYDPVTGNFDSWHFPLNESLTVAESTYAEQVPESSAVTLEIVTVLAPSDTDSPINNVYVVEETDIEQVNIERFTTQGEETVDYGVYILSLLRLPFEVDAGLIAGVNSVKLGDRTLSVSVPQVITDKITVDLGEISIPEIEMNSLDYTNVQTILHLPFMGSVNVDHRQVIGETIGIEYVINVYDGSATFNLTSSKVDGEVFHSSNFEMGISIPYKTEGQGQQLHNNANRPIGDNHIRTPFIEVVRNNAVLPYGFFTVPIVDEGQLSGETGFVTVDNVELEVEALSIEKELIINKLSSGVIIK